MPDDQAQTKDDRPTLKPFNATLQEQRRGELHQELSEGLAELVAAVMEHDKAGTLQLTLKVKPAGDGEQVHVIDTVKVSAPKADNKPSIFFADDAGNLSRRNPRQPELPLRKLEGGAQPTDAQAAEAATT